jgi:hypothetical protein
MTASCIEMVVDYWTVILILKQAKHENTRDPSNQLNSYNGNLLNHKGKK